MQQSSRLMLATVALAFAGTSIAAAQSAPMPASIATPAATNTPGIVPKNAPTPPPTGGGSMGTPAPAQAPNENSGSHDGQIKKLRPGALSRSQVIYGLTHQVQAAKMLLKVKTVRFENLRVYKVPTALKSMLKQTTPAIPSANDNASPIQYLRDVLANINVSNALNSLDDSNVNVNVAFSNVLKNNNISLDQVVGLYIGGGGIITTITK